MLVIWITYSSFNPWSNFIKCSAKIFEWNYWKEQTSMFIWPQLINLPGNLSTADLSTSGTSGVILTIGVTVADMFTDMVSLGLNDAGLKVDKGRKDVCLRVNFPDCCIKVFMEDITDIANIEKQLGSIFKRKEKRRF